MKTNTITAATNQWRGVRNWTTAAALLSLLALAGVVRAQSVTNVIYVDSFARVGQLVGTSPDTVDAGGTLWQGGATTATNAIITDGTEAALTNRLDGYPWATAYLPLQIETGHVYTVSCSILGNTNDNQNWLAMGFAIAPGQVNTFSSANVGVAWLLSRCSNNGCQFFGGTGTANPASPETFTYGNMPAGMNYSIVLNTATNPALWSVTFYTNGVYASVYNYATIPTAENGMWPSYVGLGETSGARGYFRNFTVTDVVLSATAPGIIEQPNNLTAQVGHTTTFWVNAVALPDPTYQWMTNSTGGVTNAIVGATNATYTTPPLSMAYNGLNYSVAVSTAAGSTNSALATLTVNPGQPTIFSATKTLIPTNVVVMFSGPVDPVTSQTAANYSLNNGASVIAASAGAVPGSIVLQTSALNTNDIYYLSVQNVQDLFGDSITSTNALVLPAGLVLYLRGDSGIEVDSSGNVAQWLDQTTNGNNAQQFFGMRTNISGKYVSSTQARPSVGTIGLNNLPSPSFNSANDNFLTALPSPSLVVNSAFTLFTFASPVNYSVQGRDLLNEAQGNLPAGFDFQIADPNGAPSLQLGDGSYNLGPADPGPTLTVAAHFWSVTSQNIGTNAAVTGTTNLTTYYVDGTQYTNNVVTNVIDTPSPAYAWKPLYVGWRSDHYASAIWDGQIGEEMLFNRKISGADLTNLTLYFAQKYYPLSISPGFTASTTTSNGFAVTYGITASEGPITSYFSYQWQLNGTNISGATNTSYTTPILGPANSNSMYNVLVTLPNGSIISSITNTLAVIPASPFVTSAGIPIWNTNQIYVIFDVAVDPVTGTTATNYSLNNGATVLSAAIGDAPNKVILTTSALTWNANPGNYSLTVQNVQDLYGSTIVTASTPVGLYPVGTALWLKANTGVTADGSGNVSQWNDLSGNGNTLYTVSGIEPQLATNANGYPVIRFAGTNNTQMTAYSSATLAITGDMSIGAVINFATLSGGTNGEIVGKTGSTSANEPAPYDYYVNSADAILLRGNGTINGSFAATNGPSVGQSHILAVSESGNMVSHFLDGNPAGTGLLSGNYSESNDADAGQVLSIGTRGDDHNRLTGDISEMIMASSPLSSNDIVALNNYFAASYSVPIGTNSYPLITQQPVASTNVSQDAPLIVPAVATGNPAVALQWFDTNNIAQAGQTNATLDISDIQASDSYYLVATNMYGSVTSRVVAVTVVSGLNVSLGPPSVTLYAGQPFTFAAQASGTVPFYYQWYQGASLLANANNSTYTTIASLGSTSYSCTVTNPFNGYSSTNAGPVTLTGIAAPTTLYQTTVLGNQPVAYWRLSEGPDNGSGNNGTFAYDYVGGHNAVYSNTVLGLTGFSSLSSTDTATLFGSLTLSNSYAVEINQSSNGLAPINFAEPTNYNAELSIEAWVVSSNTPISGAGIITKGYGGGGEQFDLDDYNGAFRFFVRDVSDTTHGVTSAVAPVVGQWYHVVAVWDGVNGAAHLYINGVDVGDTTGVAAGVGLLTATTTNTAFPGTTLVSIGARASSQSVTNRDLQFDGNIQDVALYNYALSPAQVLADYVAGAKDAVFTTTPTNIVVSSANNQLTLSWPLSNWGWQLQAQTNNVSVGISTNWVNVTGTIGTNQVIIPINLTNGSVFYRLMFP